MGRRARIDTHLARAVFQSITPKLGEEYRHAIPFRFDFERGIEGVDPTRVLELGGELSSDLAHQGVQRKARGGLGGGVGLGESYRLGTQLDSMFHALGQPVQNALQQRIGADCDARAGQGCGCQRIAQVVVNLCQGGGQGVAAPFFLRGGGRRGAGIGLFVRGCH